MKTILVGSLVTLGMAGLVSVAPVQSNQEEPPKMPSVNVTVQHFDQGTGSKVPVGLDSMDDESPDRK